MAAKKFDLVVLGGGNAASLAMRMASSGWTVALVEADLLGGTCPNRGCVPSKLLLGYAEASTLIRRAKDFHIDAEISSLDPNAMIEETAASTIRVVDGKIAGKLPESCTLYRGQGKFVGERQIEVNGEILEGMKVVVATGTRPVMPHAFADLGAWTSDDVFTMETVPESITIVGGGYIACELAWFFASVGVKTKMLVRGDVLLRAEDQSIRPLFREGFCEEVDVSFQTKIETASFADGQFTIDVETISEGGELVKSTLTSEKLLFAIGRESTADAINGEAAGVALDESGFVQTDEFLRTSAEEVFALGDVAGRHLFTHSAAWEAIYLGDCWLEGKTEELDYGPMPHAVFSYPEVAGVGKTEQELVNEGISYTKGSVEYTSAAKGRAVKEKHGLCKFLLDAESGEILGCHIVGHQAATLIHQVLAAMKWRNHIRSLTEMIYIHPSLAEVVRNAARVAKKNWEAAQEKR